MIILDRCPVCGHEVFEDIIFTYPMARFKHCEYCGWSKEEEPTYEDNDDEQ